MASPGVAQAIREEGYCRLPPSTTPITTMRSLTLALDPCIALVVKYMAAGASSASPWSQHLRENTPEAYTYASEGELRWDSSIAGGVYSILHCRGRSQKQFFVRLARICAPLSSSQCRLLPICLSSIKLVSTSLVGCVRLEVAAGSSHRTERRCGN